MRIGLNFDDEGFTKIINTSEVENLGTVMWANGIVDPNHPDTFREPV